MFFYKHIAHLSFLFSRKSVQYPPISYHTLHIIIKPIPIMHRLSLLLYTIFLFTGFTVAISIPRAHPCRCTTSTMSTATLSPSQRAKLSSILALTPLASSELSAGAATTTAQPSRISGALTVHIAGKDDFKDRRFDEGYAFEILSLSQARS